jgi:hypothetical protein
LPYCAPPLAAAADGPQRSTCNRTRRVLQAQDGRASFRRQGLGMDRRTFARLVAGTWLLEPFALRAQQIGAVDD